MLMFNTKLTVISIVFQIYNFVSCENFNLFGIPGQGYIVEVRIGTPPQKLHVLVDTGSTTLAVAGLNRSDISAYFHGEKSTTVYNQGSKVHSKYTSGEWSGDLVTDIVRFPSLTPSAPEVQTDVALIATAHDFFMKDSGWQGILGLAYRAIAASGSRVATSWLESLERVYGHRLSFNITLCGVTSSSNVSHYGNFEVINDAPEIKDHYRTPILIERWYEIGVLNAYLAHENSNVTAEGEYGAIDTCRLLNEEHSIIDSGTTNIRLPESVLRMVVDELRDAARSSKILILDEFWYHGEAACWPQSIEWSLPWLALDILDNTDHSQYFTIELPPQNYMRLVSAKNASGSSGTVAEFCYKLGIETGNGETVLGVAAMEGLQVIFNKSASWVGFHESNCSPTRISGPKRTKSNLYKECRLEKSQQVTAVSTIKAAQWAALAALTLAMSLLMYLLAPCIKTKCMRSLRRTSHSISLSRAALVDIET